MKLTLHRFELPLTHPFRIARSVTTVQVTFIVELEQDGIHGYGEATEDSFYGHTFESMSKSLNTVREELETAADWTPETLWEQLDPKLKNDRFAQCALDEAAWDLYGKQQGKKTHEIWGGQLTNPPPTSYTSYTIGIDTVEKMIEKLNEKQNHPVFKIKLGVKNDVEIVRALRKETAAPFYVDANCAWTPDEAIKKSKQLRDLNVIFIEQPLVREDVDGLQHVFKNSALPIMADESCQAESDVARCAGTFHGVNVKVVKCGGLTPAKRMITQARELGLKTMVGCMTESTVGISASAQLLPWLDYADLDGAMLIAKDIATGISVENGFIQYSDKNGNGVQLLG